jgi:hypothetical protein
MSRDSYYGGVIGMEIKADDSRTGHIDDGSIAWPERVVEAARQWPQAPSEGFEQIGRRRWRDRASGAEYREESGAPLLSIGTDAVRDISLFFVAGGKLIFLARADVPEGNRRSPRPRSRRRSRRWPDPVGVDVKPRPWWETHPVPLWTAEDWREARRLGVAPPELPDLDADPAERLLGQQAQAGGKSAGSRHRHRPTRAAARSTSCSRRRDCGRAAGDSRTACEPPAAREPRGAAGRATACGVPRSRVSTETRVERRRESCCCYENARRARRCVSPPVTFAPARSLPQLRTAGRKRNVNVWKGVRATRMVKRFLDSTPPSGTRQARIPPGDFGRFPAIFRDGYSG